MEIDSWYDLGYKDAHHGKDHSDRIPKDKIGSYKEGRYRFWEEYYLCLVGEYNKTNFSKTY